MKYFKVIGPTVEEDAFVTSELDDDTPEQIAEIFNLGPSVIVEITEEEFKEATADIDDEALFEEELSESCVLND